MRNGRADRARRFCRMSPVVRLLCVLAGLFLLASSSADAVPTHLDKKILKTGCSTCHKGHGRKGTTLLTKAKDEFCFQCHGPSGSAADIYRELSKPSNHRILETAQYHRQGEELPETDPGMLRHASCYDCHNVHKSEKENRLKGLRGYKGKGAKTGRITRQYEVCYNCHSESANLRSEELNISLDFSSSNPSYHPVEAYGKKQFGPSLKRGYSSSRMIDCSDCHGNDDASGPKGPHGSNYQPILRFQYIRNEGPESPVSYALCYSCHDRTSILGDESFKSHKMHIVFNRISCAHCHDSHGSRFNPSLINFDKTVVFPNSYGEITFLPTVPGRPRCYLSCHIGGRVSEHKLDKMLYYRVNGRRIQE